MYSRFRRRTSPAQKKLNSEKLEKSKKLVGQRFTHQGRVYSVVRADEVTGDAVARVGRKEQPFHPEQVELYISANAAQG